MGDCPNSQVGKLGSKTKEWKDSKVMGMVRIRAGVWMLCLLRLSLPTVSPTS